MAIIEKLNAIGDAIRAKNGAEEKYTLDGMVAAIGAIETGGSGGDLPEEAFLLTGNCSYKFCSEGWNWFINLFGDKITTSKVSNMDRMFYNNNTITAIPFDINTVTGSVNGGSMFYNCYNLEAIPELKTKTVFNEFGSVFQGCRSIKEIPQSWADNVDCSYLYTQKYANAGGMIINGCYKLKSIPDRLLSNLHPHPEATTYNYFPYHSSIASCYSLEAVPNVTVSGVFTSNAFSNWCSYCYRLKSITFNTNEDGTPLIANWKNQTIDLTKYVGFCSNKADMYGYTDSTISDYIANGTDLETYNNIVATRPNWFTDYYGYAAYDKDSAIETINSLPDTKAALANGGTNTIKFKANQGGGKGKNISNLTADEIAVAAAKGWTVTIA